ncbi:aminodeoxychorismate synthase component I [Kallotenue papyrolyticum]|uniref:aminodeoxychorismate synthase component I n=1 Tax=Kallotenue papyrolyticum TaxID=1325125 RepID=UPI0004BAAD1B|nr:aminodeoxychorismate synthase component I [Kallotenue papyrolyticum]
MDTDRIPELQLAFATATGGRRLLAFTDPLALIVAERLEQVLPALRQAEAAARAGYYVVGFVAYEAAPAFDRALVTHAPSALPLVWFGVFAAPSVPPPPPCGTFRVGPWQPNVDPATYRAHIAAVRDAIARGVTYQTNYTIRLRARFEGDARAFYAHLCAAQRADYCADLHLGRFRILSASPELFFAWHDGLIVTRPMKGTARRGRWPEEDEQAARALQASLKNRAENLMIVDLLRNDLGRIAEIGSVQVPALFTLERYPTVWQLTSTVRARTRAAVTLVDIFQALFPCGSVTGAPKASTMRLISELEAAPRGVYCGAIGLIEPGGAATFSVAIRTLLLDTVTGMAEYGVGGGITWDSTAADEYDEALAKAAVLTAAQPSFDLLETLRLERGTYLLRERHVQRLLASAAYWDVPLTRASIDAVLDEHARRYAHEPRRVRLLVGCDGTPRVESRPLEPLPPEPLPVALARAPVCSTERWLYHKTTYRAIYEAHRAEQAQVYDVLLWNEAGELTEFTTGNLVLELDGRCWTPPLAAGLLPGTQRAEALAQGQIAERRLTRDDLRRATRIWLINSVRGWVEVRLVMPPPTAPDAAVTGAPSDADAPPVLH